MLSYAMFLPFAASIASAAEPECHTVVGDAAGVPVYADPLAERPVARISIHAEVWVFPDNEARWQVQFADRVRWIDRSAVGGPCAAAPPPAPAPAAIVVDAARHDAGLGALADAWVRRHRVPGALPYLAVVEPSAEAAVRATLTTWRILPVETLPAPLAPSVAAEVRDQRLGCAAVVHRVDGAWQIEAVAGWCYRPPTPQ